MLRIEGLEAGYGAVQVLRGLSLSLPPGAVTCLMGRNGAGKSTLLRSIMGLTDRRAGTIHLGETRLDDRPAHEVPQCGIGYVPQGRRLFGAMTVAENLEIGLMVRRPDAARRAQVLRRVLELFPRLGERMGQQAATLSGGEQQMLAIGRALCLEPQILMLDEPTEGLQPSMIALIRQVMRELKSQGVTILLVEHRVEAVLELADHVAFMLGGTVPEICPASALRPDSRQFGLYVGI